MYELVLKTDINIFSFVEIIYPVKNVTNNPINIHKNTLDITLFSKGDSIKYHMRGNLLTQDESCLYLWPNLTDMLDSLVFKSDSI